ncbi:hypothetical protein HYW55_03635 [Candidatus Gottesmanbacteria bacterium]|nr:hypothetical protein [Candidatus Gottesmanbacteria bacterium]
MKISPVTKRAFVTAILFTVWLRLSTFLIGWILLSLVSPIPYFVSGMDFVERIPEKSSPLYIIMQPLMRFDALWYKNIAIFLYQDSPQSAAFFPLYPLVLRVFLLTGFTFEQGAFVLNTFLVFLVFFLLYLFAKEEKGERTSLPLVTMYAFFPTSFFLLAPYAESLLLVLLIGLFLLLRKKKYFWASFVAALAASTKPFAIVVFLPLLYTYYKSSVNLRNFLPRFISLFLIPLAYIFSTFFQDSMTGVPFSSIKAQNFWGIKYTLPWDLITAEWNYLFSLGYTLPNHVNLFLATSGGILVVLSKRLLRTDIWILSLLLYLVFTVTSTKYSMVPFFSFSRYALILFPLFLSVVSFRIQPTYKIMYLGASVLFFSLYFALFVVGLFIA